MWNIFECWFFEKHCVEGADITLLQMLSQSEEALDEEKEADFWRLMISRGYKRGVPGYICVKEWVL